MSLSSCPYSSSEQARLTFVGRDTMSSSAPPLTTLPPVILSTVPVLPWTSSAILQNLFPSSGSSASHHPFQERKSPSFDSMNLRLIYIQIYNTVHSCFPRPGSPSSHQTAPAAADVGALFAAGSNGSSHQRLHHLALLICSLRHHHLVGVVMLMAILAVVVACFWRTRREEKEGQAQLAMQLQLQGLE